MNKVLLTNAYRPGNQGDLMLVRESISLLREFEVSKLIVNSLEPESFRGELSDQNYGVIDLQHSKSQPLIGISNQTLEQIEFGLAVGGGYLRFGSLLESFKANAIHLAQLRKLVHCEIPFGMLPQSIGPANFIPSDLGEILESATWLAARDDRTFDLVSRLAPSANVWRCPDLIALKLIDPPNKTEGKQVGIILKKDPFINASVIADLLQQTNVEVMIQSDTGRKNKDSEVTARFTANKQRSASIALESGEIGAVISMRLHGALASISKGIPAIHIATERKGYGVFEDLGLTKFLFNRRKFDSDLVYKLANELIYNEELKSEYWECVSKSILSFGSARVELRRRISTLMDSSR
jgi:polysaccharide pyruvyl transferase WcaK-like protein